MSNPKDNRTPVITMMDLVADNTNKATSHSWQRVNSARREALNLMIGAGFEFTERDIHDVMAGYGSQYWADAEAIYATAVREGNLSAAKSCEAWLEREPFIADDVSPSKGWSGLAHKSGSRTKCRLYVGAQFPWRGENVTVTSFADDGSYLVAVSHAGNANDYPRKIKKRCRITRADIIVERAERKKRKVTVEELHAIAKELGAERVQAALGVTAQKQLDAMPTERIREVIKRLGGKHRPKRDKGITALAKWMAANGWSAHEVHYVRRFATVEALWADARDRHPGEVDRLIVALFGDNREATAADIIEAIRQVNPLDTAAA